MMEPKTAARDQSTAQFERKAEELASSLLSYYTDEGALAIAKLLVREIEERIAVVKDTTIMKEFRVRVPDGDHYIWLGPFYGESAGEIRRECEEAGHKVHYVQYVRDCEETNSDK
jgi:hypothetical protein